MRFTLLLAVAGLLIGPASAQVFMTENFDYPVGQLLTDNGWINHSGTGFFLEVTDNNLTMTGYPPSTGNSTNVTGGSGSREDAHFDFLAPAGQEGSPTVYTSMLASFDSTDTDAEGGFFFHLTPVPHNASFFRGRIFARSNVGEAPLGGGTFFFGISKASTTEIAWVNGPRFTGTIYLLVMKYTFNGGVDDDTVDLFVFEEGDDFSTEPGTPTVSATDVASDLENAGGVNLRQGSDDLGLTVDGIRVAGTWADIVPVELVSFDATVSGSNLNLNWLTSSETNNAGFEVQLKGLGDYEARGFVDGHGTTTIEQSYSYTISGLAPGTYTARLKQIDFDGAFAYSPQVEIAVGVPGTHVLTQAYPNPFNPQASFSLSVAAAQHVEVALYNVIGQQVGALFSGQMEAGQARAFTIDGANLPSGSYYYRAIGQTFAESGRVTLLK